MENRTTEITEINESLNQNTVVRDSSPQNASPGSGIHKFANFLGIVGGATFVILNHATKGKVPGGFIGGFIGYFLGYIIGFGIGYLFSSLMNNKDF